MVKRFKILTLEDIEIASLLGGEKVNRDGDSWGNENIPIVQTNSDPTTRAAQPEAGTADRATLNKSNRKRDREEAFGTGKVEDATIESVLNNIKGRVLNGETLNNFKKDVNQLVELIEKKDPQMERLPDIVGA